MKIKEKGLTGKAASIRKDNINNKPHGFNAFREMEKNKPANAKALNKEIFLDFFH